VTLVDPSPDFPDDTLLAMIRLPALMRAALIDAGLKTVGEVRAARSYELRQLPDLGLNSVTYLRLTLGQ
jgi:hypothetical protein